jgi:BolA family transcriptional regulator, general stress-responsive regulator
VSIADQIEACLLEGLSPERLIVIDESAAHAGHAGHREGGESHFRVRILAETFAGMSRVERHRRVNALLRPAFERGIHALAIEAAAPGEAVGW